MEVVASRCHTPPLTAREAKEEGFLPSVCLHNAEQCVTSHPHFPYTLGASAVEASMPGLPWGIWSLARKGMEWDVVGSWG